VDPGTESAEQGQIVSNRHIYDCRFTKVEKSQAVAQISDVL